MPAGRSAHARDPPPPEVIELTPQLIASSGFSSEIWTRGAFSMIRLHFPPAMGGALVPHSTTITTRDLQGNLLQDSMNWASNIRRNATPADIRSD